jgi:hypothetical protein
VRLRVLHGPGKQGKCDGLTDDRCGPSEGDRRTRQACCKKPIPRYIGRTKGRLNPSKCRSDRAAEVKISGYRRIKQVKGEAF